jgi:hypothetical protein
VLALAAAALVLLTGCDIATDPPPPASSAPAPVSNPGLDAWTDRMCTDVANAVDAFAAVPKTDPRDPGHARQVLLDYFDTALSAVDIGERDFGARSNDAPVQDAVKLARAMAEHYGSLRPPLAKARETLQQASPTDTGARDNATDALVFNLGSAQDVYRDAVQRLRTPPFADPAARSANCQHLFSEAR